MHARGGWSSARGKTALRHVVFLACATSGCSALTSLDQYDTCLDCPPDGAAGLGDKNLDGGPDEGAAADSGHGRGTDGASGVVDAGKPGDAGPPAGYDAGDAGRTADAGDGASGAADAATADASDAGTLGMGLLAYYPFDETSGTTSADASGNGYTASLLGGATFAAGLRGNAVTLSGTSQYVSLPTGILSSTTSFSIAAWVKLTSAPMWCRIFDFGAGTNDYMFLTANSGSTTRFAITTGGGGQEQQVNATPTLPTGTWEHVAITLSGTTATLYVQGAQVAQNTNVTLTPTSLGNTTQNWLGRSEYGADPYLTGQIDNFRIYSRALSASEVQTLHDAQL
jgi:hypothetical protein